MLIQDRLPREARIEDQTHAMIARTAEGDEQERLWSGAIREYPVFEGYQQKTDREMPVVVLHAAARPALGEDKADQGQEK